MKNCEALKIDGTPIQIQLDVTRHVSDERPLKEMVPVESIRRTTHRLNIKAVIAEAKLAKKSNNKSLA